MKLYEIAQEYQSVFEALTESGQFDLAIIEDTLSPITKSFEDKAKNVVAYINNLNSSIESLKEHEKNIISRRKSYENEVEKYRNYIKINMMKCKMKSLKCPLFDITIKNTTPSLVIEDELSLPTEYIKTRTIIEVDKARLKSDLNDGLILTGAYIVQNNSLTIKIK